MRVKDCNILSPPLLLLHLLTAGSAFSVLEKLLRAAAGIVTASHECAATMLTALLHKGPLATMGASYVKGAATTGTKGLFLGNRAQASGAVVAKGASTLASRAKTGIALNVRPAMNTRLFIASQAYTSCLAPQLPQKRVPGARSAPY